MRRLKVFRLKLGIWCLEKFFPAIYTLSPDGRPVGLMFLFSSRYVKEWEDKWNDLEKRATNHHAITLEDSQKKRV